MTVDGGVASVFEKQYGPLAAWQWLGLGIGGYLIYSRFISKGSTAASDAASGASGSTVGDGSVDPITGQPVTAADLISGQIGASYDLSNQLGILNSNVVGATTAVSGNTAAQGANTAATSGNTVATTGNTTAINRLAAANSAEGPHKKSLLKTYADLQQKYLNTQKWYSTSSKNKAAQAQLAKVKSQAAAALVAYRKAPANV